MMGENEVLAIAWQLVQVNQLKLLLLIYEQE